MPLGLSMAIPLILSSRRVSYNDQGKFSFAIWPYSIKLLWAPIVDSVFIRRIGRRKTWLIPTQYLIGIFMFTFADTVQTVLDDRRSDEPSMGVGLLAVIFFVFNLLATIQVCLSLSLSLSLYVFICSSIWVILNNKRMSPSTVGLSIYWHRKFCFSYLFNLRSYVILFFLNFL